LGKCGITALGLWSGADFETQNLNKMQVIKKEKQMKEVDVTIESYTLCDKCNEGGSGEKQEMELCQNCAVKLVDLLRANGYRVTDSEWDW
jgi:hypothetical protein